jgi:hypothetical protein
MAILDCVGGVDNPPRQAISFATQSVPLVDNTERARRTRTPNLLILSVRPRESAYASYCRVLQGIPQILSVDVRVNPGRFGGVCVRKVETCSGPEPIALEPRPNY